MKDGIRENRPHNQGGVVRLTAWLASLPDLRLTLLVSLVLFVLGAWPLLLVAVPPLLDLPSHMAAAHIAEHLDLYPQYVFNGFFRSNAIVPLWLHLLGRHDLLAAGRAFTAIVIAANALGLPFFVLHFGGRRRMLVASLLVWPLVHGFFVSMGMLNFAFAFPSALTLLVALDRQRQAPSVLRGLSVAAVSVLPWYAHPFPLMVVVGLVVLEVASRPGWRARRSAGLALLSPLVPVGSLVCVIALRHLIKAPGAPVATSTSFAFLNPWELVWHFWLDASGALTRWGSMTVVPALLLPVFAWRGRDTQVPFLSKRGTIALVVAYLGLPLMLSNWWYLNCRLVPFLWAAFALRVPTSLSRRMSAVLLACALSFSVVLGIDYLRLDGNRAAFTAGISAVPERATLLPLLFKHGKTSDFTASLTHDWGYYVMAKNTSAPLAGAVERSHALTYRVFPPAMLIPPALDRLAELHGTPERHCRASPILAAEGEAGCKAAWDELWRTFWGLAEPRFTHVLTWAMPSVFREVIPASYQSVFAAGELEIFARPAVSPVAAGARP
ncbi:MAG: hypothetical protein WCG85_07170 [Polyangia bacterium]